MLKLEYQKDLPTNSHAAANINNGLSDESSVVFQNDTLRQQSPENTQISIPADRYQSITPSHATVTEEVHESEEQIRLLKIQAAPGLLNPTKEQPRQIALEESETLQRMNECLRKHFHEWGIQAPLGVSLTPDEIDAAIDKLQRSVHVKEMARHGFQTSEKDWAETLLRRLDSSDDDDDDEKDLREELMARRHEYVKIMSINAELVSEELLGLRLKKQKRKRERATQLKKEMEREAEFRRAERHAEAMRAAAAKERGDNDEVPRPNDEEVLIPFIPETPIYAKPKINTLDWRSFIELSKVKESSSCVIDVLVGEPAVEEEVMRSPYSWGYNWNGRTRTAEKSQTQKPINPVLISGPRGQDPLPERIRIHSSFVLRILEQFIDPDGATLNVDAPSVVFLRPFKAFAHYEPRLRGWLEKLKGNIDDDKLAAFYGPATEEGIITPTDYNDNNSKELESATAMAHVRCVLDFFDTYIAAKIAFLSSSNCRKASFSDLWYLYRPGIEVIGSDGRQAYRVIQVTSAKHRPVSMYQPYYNYGVPGRDGEESEKAEFSLTCVYIDFDGKYIGPALKKFEIKRFDGERDITSLDIYPLRFHKLKRSDFSEAEWNELEKYQDEGRCREHLIRRGKKFVEVAAIKHMYHSGSTMVVREEVESQVVIDFETAFATEGEIQEHIKRPSLENFIGEVTENKDTEDSSTRGKCACCRFDTVFDDGYVDKNQCTEHISNLLSNNNTNESPSIVVFPRLFKELQTNPTTGYVFSEDELAIMSYRVFGFVLRSRKWAQLDLTYLTEVKEPSSPASSIEDDPADTTFGRLVLEKGHKAMIVSLITQHFKDREAKGASMEQFDIVRGKGKGLILLLHGAPGVGKTSTAEGVAERFKKPLFQITCGDLGVTARDVEQTLETNFNLATKWGCILLLDEADVFLAARDKEDFVRNGLVAAFLRVLEYYAGILFLTTNRIGDFDEAFTSRIHMSLYYPELDKGKTNEIFKLNLKLIQDRFNRMKRKIDIDYKGIENFAEMHFSYYSQSRWNGRQIRNACQTALALAEYETQQNGNTIELGSNAKVSLTIRHFEIVRRAYLEFTIYLRELHGNNDSGRAKESILRVDGDPNLERDVILTTEQISEVLDRQSRRDTQPRQLSRGRKYRQTDNEIQQLQLRQVQNSSSINDRNQSMLLSPPIALQFQTSVHSQRSSRHASNPPNTERAPVELLQNAGQQTGIYKELSITRQPGEFRDTDHEYSSSRDTSTMPVRPLLTPQEYQHYHPDQHQQARGNLKKIQDNNSGYNSFQKQPLPAVDTSSKKESRFRFRRRK